MEKALPSGSRKANIAGTPGKRKDFVGVDSGGLKLLVRGFGIVCGETAADCAAGQVGRGGFDGDDHVVVAGGEFDPAPTIGVGLSRSVVKPSVST